MTPADNQLVSVVEHALEQAGMRGLALVAGLSGGIDSVVLLHCLQRLAPVLELRLSALHINHGLSSHADRWATFCAELCSAWGVPFSQVRVEVDEHSPLGLEAAAREARYRVFHELGADAVVLAHHRDDQVETLLLQLLRGAGVRGLSAMPPVRTLNRHTGLRVVRPMLHVAREKIQRYARELDLQWVEDEANAHLRFDRNFIRQEIVPPLLKRFPGAPVTLQRAADNFADAAQLHDEIARQDGESALHDDALDARALHALSPARARNVLRWFVERHGHLMPSRDQLEEALRQSLHAGRDAQVDVKLGTARLRVHRGMIVLQTETAALPESWSCSWNAERQIELPSGLGKVAFDPSIGAGLSLDRLGGAPMLLRARRGGERLRLAGNRPLRTLKNLLQEAGVPAWDRAAMPLLFQGETLVWVPGIGFDHRYLAQPGEAGVLPRWVRDE